MLKLYYKVVVVHNYESQCDISVAKSCRCETCHSPIENLKLCSVLVLWVTSVNSVVLTLASTLTATNVLLHDRPVSHEILLLICGDPEVNCYDLFSAVAGTFLA